MSDEATFSLLSQIYPVSRETFQRFNILVERVEEWQKKTNLVAPSTLNDIWNRHIADSLQCISLKPEARSFVDIGSGGGFPGLVIAAIMAEYENTKVDLIESIQKKCSFLRQVNRQMSANANIHCARIEDVSKTIKTPEIVTARALAALPLLLELSSPWLLDGATALFHKGRDFETELADCNGLWEFDLVSHNSAISSDSVILEINNLQCIDQKYVNLNKK